MSTLAATNLKHASSASNNMVLDSNGRVGIGTASPNATLAVTGTDVDGNQANFDGSTPFSAVNIPFEDYIPFNQLTEDIVIGWVRNKIEAKVTTGNYTFCEDDRINQYIEKQISLLKDPIRTEPLPWANNS